MENVKSGFFFECSEMELEKLRELGDGDAAKGLRKLLESKNMNLLNTINTTLKDMGKVLVDASPQILSNFLNARGGKK